MPNPTKRQKFYDNMFRSMLAPQSYMSGLIAGGKDYSASYYEVPDGMTEEQAMMVTLGAILSDDNIYTMSTGSSPFNNRRLNWNRTWFIRDYAGDDESRAFGMQDGIQQGRMKAKELFEKYKAGDHSVIAPYLKVAGNAIVSTYYTLDLNKDVIVDNGSAGARLLMEASGNPEFDKMMGYDDAQKASLTQEESINAFREEYREGTEKYHQLPENTPEEKRKQILMDLAVKAAIAYDFSRYRDGIYESVQSYRDENLAFNYSVYKDAQIINLENKLFDIYQQTHPYSASELLKTPEGCQKLYHYYEENLKADPEFMKTFNTEGVKPEDFSSMGLGKKTWEKIPDPVSNSQRQKLQEEWKTASAPYFEKLREAEKFSQNFNGYVDENLKKISDANGMGKYSVVGSDILESHGGMSDVLRDGDEVYLVSEDYQKILAVRCTDGRNFTTEELEEVPANPWRGMNVNNIHANEILKPMQEALTLQKQITPETKQKIEKDPAFSALFGQYDSFRQMAQKSVGHYAQKHSPDFDKAGKLSAELSNYINQPNSPFKELAQQAKTVVDHISAAHQTATEKIRQNIDRHAATRGDKIPIEDRRKVMDSLGKAPSMYTFAELQQSVLDMQRRIKNSALSSNEQVMQSVEKLNEKIKSYSTKDNEGKLPTFDVAGLNALLDDVATIDKNLEGVARAEFKQNIKDISLTLAQIDPTKGGSLPDCVNDVGHLSISTGAEINTVGDKASSRQMLNVKSASGKEAEGFFTEDEPIFHVDEKYEKIIRRAMQKHPEDKKLQEFGNRILNNPYGVYSIVASMDNNYGSDFFGDDKNQIDLSKALDSVRAVDTGLIPDKNEIKLIAKGETSTKDEYYRTAVMLVDLRFAMKDDEILNAVNEFIRYGKLRARGLDVEPGTSVAGRNVAMSRAANVLGIPHLVARSVPVTVEREGKKLKGIMMEKARGWDFPGTDDSQKIAHGPFTDLPDNAMDGEGLKSLADLQVLDFICQNEDRHSRNMFYEFDDNGKLKSVMGIDNDLSFGRIEMPDDTNLQNGTALDAITVVTESMAKHLEALTPEMLASSLSDTGLTNKEIQAACRRLERVQTRLAESRGKVLPEGKKAHPGIMRIVPDSEWKDMKLDDLSHNEVEYSDSIFHIADSVTSAIKKGKKYRKEHPEEFQKAAEKKAEKKVSKFVDSQELDELAPARLQEKMAKMKEFRKTLKSTDGLFNTRGTQYSAMVSALNHMLETPLPTDRELTDAERQMYDTRLDKLNEAVRNYVEYKAPRGDTGTVAETRLATAQELSAFTKEHLETFRTAALEKEEKELAEAYQEYKQEQKNELSNEELDEMFGWYKNAHAVKEKKYVDKSGLNENLNAGTKKIPADRKTAIADMGAKAFSYIAGMIKNSASRSQKLPSQIVTAVGIYQMFYDKEGELQQDKYAEMQKVHTNLGEFINTLSKNESAKQASNLTLGELTEKMMKSEPVFAPLTQKNVMETYQKKFKSASKDVNKAPAGPKPKEMEKPQKGMKVGP